MTFVNGWEGPRMYASQLGEPVQIDWDPPTPRVGIVPPRPLALGDVLSGAFKAVRFAPASMFGLTLVVTLVAQVLGTLAGFVLQRQLGGFSGVGDDTFDDFATFTVSGLGGALASGLAAVVVNMGLMYVVWEAVRGNKVPPGQAVQHMFRRLWPALGFSALTGVAVVAAAGIVFGLGVLAGERGGLISLVVILGLGLLVLASWVGVRLMLAPCAIAVENAGPIQSIRRSWVLTRGRFWRLLGIYLLSGVLISIAASTVSQVFAFAGILVAFLNPEIATLVILTISSVVSTVLTVPLTSAVLTLLHLDTRIRVEGYDLALSEELYG